ncbi:MAG: PAS domain S-box protein [Gemmatimonadota bacterium]
MPPMSMMLASANYAFSGFAVPPLVTAVVCVALGGLVLLRERGSRIGWSFFSMTVAGGIWLFSFGFVYLSVVPEVALAWSRLAYLGVPFLAPTIHGFVIRLLGVQESRRQLHRIAWVGATLTSALVLGTDWMVVGVERYFWGYYDRVGWPMLAFIVFFLFFLGASQWDLIRAYGESEGIHRHPLRSFILLLTIASIALLSYLPAIGVPLYPFDYLPTIIFIIGAVRTMERHELVDITAAFAAEPILATVGDPLLVCDAVGRIRVSNEAATRTLGWTAQELAGRRLSSLAADQRGSDLLDELLVRPLVRDREIELVGREGDAVDMSVSISRLQDGHGRPVGAVMIARDVRQRKRIEAALRQSERYFRALIENAHDIVTVVSREGQIIYESPAVDEVLGTPADQRVGKDVFEKMHPEDRPRAREAFELCVEEPNAVMTGEFRLIRLDGAERIVEVTARNLIHEPSVGGVVVHSRDVTESRRIEEQLRQAQRLEAVGRLAGGVAHDFNNVLTVLVGHVHLLLDEMSLDSPMRADLEEIRRGAERAAALTRQLLTFSRQQVNRPANVHINAVVDGIREMISRLLGDNVVPEFRLAARLPAIRADTSQLEQVIMNLVLNARDAMLDGGTLTIGTAAAHVEQKDYRGADADDLQQGDYVCLTVTDNGHGMDEETAARIFEPFFTTKPKGRGTGLGLSTVYGIVKQGGGAIRVQSQPGRGTTMQVFLPVAGAAVV